MFGNQARAIPAVLLLLAAGGTVALAGESQAVDPKTGCQIFYISDNYVLTAASWTGPVVNGKAEGKGVVTLAIQSNDGKERDQVQGEAEMAAGKFEGKASLKYSGGETFDGYYKSGIREGKGTYVWDGQKYAGDWKNGKRDGKGIYVGKGQSYDGDWKNGERDGKGTYVWEGQKYIGDWKNGKRDGKGTFYLQDGSIYEGEWKDDKRHGRGVFNNKRSDAIYDGEFRNGSPDGKGKITFLKARVTYEGGFKGGQMHGQGVYRWPDGRTLTGTFQNGQANGYGVRRDPNGKVEYEGEFIDGKPAMKAE
jgi:hypothetical protein